jgi:hypothetical protein
MGNGPSLRLGFIQKTADVVAEYQQLAKEDERAGVCLLEAGLYRHSMYFFLQAMEKLLRAKVFTRVNPHLSFFRESQRNHLIDKTVEFLLQVYGTDEQTLAHLKGELDQHLLPGLQSLNNNLRYPFYLENWDSYVVQSVRQRDAEALYNRLCWLKGFLQDIDGGVKVRIR